MRRAAAMIMMISLACCASPPDVTLGVAELRGVQDPVASEAVTNGRTPVQLARLVIAAGHWETSPSGPPVPAFLRRARGDVVINGHRLAFVDSGEAVVVDLPPGTYRLTWEPRNRLTNTVDRPSIMVSVPKVETLEAGTVRAFVMMGSDHTSLRSTPSILGTALTMSPQFNTTVVGNTVTALRPLEDPQSLVARGTIVLSPQADRIAGIPGARLAGR